MLTLWVIILMLIRSGLRNHAVVFLMVLVLSLRLMVIGFLILGLIKSQDVRMLLSSV